MQYTKSMIDLIFQIRKATPAEIRPRVKLSSSNLLTTLTDIYRMLDDDKLKLMIYELMIQAGPEWAGKLHQNATQQAQQSAFPRSSKVQREKTPLPAGRAHADEFVRPANEAKPGKDKVVIYRGRRMVIPA